MRTCKKADQKRGYKRDQSPSRLPKRYGSLETSHGATSERLERVRSSLKTVPEQPGKGIEAVVGVLLYDNPHEDLEVLIVERAKRSGDPWSGHMGLPGGRIKPSDHSQMSAVRREVLEEVGIDLDRLGVYLGTMPGSFPWNRPEMRVQPFMFGLESKPKIEMDTEIVNSFWVGLFQLPKGLARSEVETRVGPRIVDSFLVEGKVVWGFTFRVLSDFLAILSSGESGRRSS